MAANGTLIPIGGNEDKGIDTGEQYHLEFIQESILSRVVNESGGKEAKIVIIPTASSIPEEVSKNYIEAFGKLGCEDMHIMDIRSRTQSEEAENLRIIEVGRFNVHFLHLLSFFSYSNSTIQHGPTNTPFIQPVCQIRVFSKFGVGDDKRPELGWRIHK